MRSQSFELRSLSREGRAQRDEATDAQDEKLGVSLHIISDDASEPSCIRGPVVLAVAVVWVSVILLAQNGGDMKHELSCIVARDKFQNDTLMV